MKKNQILSFSYIQNDPSNSKAIKVEPTKPTASLSEDSSPIASRKSETTEKDD